MAVRQVKENERTKDGHSWIFEDRYKDIKGIVKMHKSKKFLTKKEALKAEREFLNELENF